MTRHWWVFSCAIFVVFACVDLNHQRQGVAGVFCADLLRVDRPDAACACHSSVRVCDDEHWGEGRDDRALADGPLLGESVYGEREHHGLAQFHEDSSELEHLCEASSDWMAAYHEFLGDGDGGEQAEHA